MSSKLLDPKVDLASVIFRWALAATFIVHGYFKVIQDNSLLAHLTTAGNDIVGWVELVCGVLLAVGLLSRIAALGIIPLQIAAIVMVTWKRALAGPAITPGGADYTRVGPEYNLLLIAACLGVILLGSGVFSLDHLLLRAWRRRKAAATTPAVVNAP
jgi:uncharacterized membrane protein YphA (DoxX/SURF4 family)